MHIGVFGGDLRQIHLFELLKKKYRQVDIRYNHMEEQNGNEVYDIILLPLPVSKDQVHLFAPYAKEKVDLYALFCRYSETRIIGGSVSNSVQALAAQCNTFVEDYYLEEVLLKKNAALTAEGALIMLEQTLLQRPNVLIVGFGRIGKALCSRLKNSGVSFCVTARKESDFLEMDALGYRRYETGKVKEIISEYNVIINTVPYPVLGINELARCAPTCRILDLASAPYGTDFKYCDAHNIHYDTAPGIPGKYFPVRAAEAIYETLEQILEKRGTTE
ncbi:MAG: NAD(P)-binding domain-containing protein [Clostridia bacterium]|nr:NAD(P)-binding domain-containing protein [Clostridia bacterium]